MDSELDAEGFSATPRELTGALPRKTMITGIGIQAIVATTVMMLMPVVLLVVISVSNMKGIRTRDALRSGSSETVGEVVETRKSVVHYTFSVNGAMFSGNAPMPSGLSPALRHFDLIPIRYLPANPAVNHPAAWEWNSFRNWPAFFFPFVFYVQGIAMIWDIRTKRRLLAEGVPAVATITGCSRSRYGFRATFEFRTQDGIVAAGGGGYDAPQETGARVWVVYLPQNPRRNLQYPCLSYRVVE